MTTPADDPRAGERTQPDAERFTRVIDAILSTAPKERPPHWSEVNEDCYRAYMQGKEYMLYDIADMIRKALPVGYALTVTLTADEADWQPPQEAHDAT